MNYKKFLEQFSIVSQCKKHGLSLWQCPQFLFIVMGLIIIISSVLTFFIGSRYIDDPIIVALIVLGITVILFVFLFLIVQGFEKLTEANKLKTEFVSIVSHQLRSPLSNLKMTLDLLMSRKIGSIKEEQVDYFKILKDNSDRMEAIVSDLLIVSRIETEKFFLKKENFSLADLVERTIKNFEIYAKSSNIEISLEFPKDLPKVFADSSKIQLVVENLLDNAIKYTPKKGSVKITLEKNDQKVFFKIKDSGFGIPSQDKKYIFKKFFRADNAVRHQTQGSGLGLYIAKSIIEKSGGKINFDSGQSKGTLFWFTLPIAIEV